MAWAITAQIHINPALAGESGESSSENKAPSL